MWELYKQIIIAWINRLRNQHLLEMQLQYEIMLGQVMTDLSALYMKVDQGEGVTYEEAVRFGDLQRFQRQIVARSTQLGQDNLKRTMKLLEDTYDFSYSFMSYAIETETDKLLQNAKPHLPELIKQVQDNPIYGLRLTQAQERNRNLIVQDINDAITEGLKKGETYGGIAKEIRGSFESSLRRSKVIARTETHRAQERANLEAAINSYKQGINMIKYWRNMDDERVRDRKKANHVKMEGQKRKVYEPFDLIPGGTALCPGSSGIAEQDIQCRCFASYRVDGLRDTPPDKAVEEIEKQFAEWNKKKNS